MILNESPFIRTTKLEKLTQLPKKGPLGSYQSWKNKYFEMQGHLGPLVEMAELGVV